MAAAEVRAVWQRTANRCFVQEDAKRAPKLACCPSASSSSKQVDAGPTNTVGEQDNSNLVFLPLDRKSSYSNLPPDLRWWIQLQPNYGYRRGLTSGQPNTMEAEMETFTAGLVTSNPELYRIHQQDKDDGASTDDNANAEPSIDAHWRTATTCTKGDVVRKQELVCSMSLQEPHKLKDMGESYALMEMDPTSCSDSKQESQWIGTERTEPWWRTADRDELAFLVAQKSLDLIENCDLPQPQNTHVKKEPYSRLGCFNHYGLLADSMDWKCQSGGHLNPIVHKHGNLTSGTVCGEQWASVEGRLQSGTDKPIRPSSM